jgi:hypothetical protein
VSGSGFCEARSKLPVPGNPESYFICTNAPDHKGDHTACDGQGHVLARWHSPDSTIEVWGPWGKAIV